MSIPETVPPQEAADIAGALVPDAKSIEEGFDAVAGFWSRFEAYFTTHFTLESVFWQVVTVAVAVFIGYVLSNRINAYAVAILPEPEDKGILARLRRLAAGFVRAGSMSFASGCTIALGSYLMVLAGVGSEFVICRIAYNAFFSYALLLMILGALRGIMGAQLISHTVTRVVSTVFWVLVVLQFFGILQALIAFLDATTVPIGKGTMTLWTLVMAIFTVLLTFGIANWLGRSAGGLIEANTTWTPNLKVVVSRIIYIVLMALALIVGLGAVGIDLTVLSVFGGALGVGLGFGLQKIASNYVSGFIILLDRSIKLGDLVEVSGFRGRVTEINTRFTVVRNNDGIESIVPNESFVTSMVKNHSYTDQPVVQYIDISVAYGADVERALAIMLEEGMRERPRIVKGRRGWSYLDSFGNSGINLRLGFWCTDPVNGTSSLRTAISLAIYKRFAEEGIEIPYDRLEINLREADAALRVVRENEAKQDAPKDA